MKLRYIKRTLLLTVVLTALFPTASSAHHHRRHTPSVSTVDVAPPEDLSPVVVLPYVADPSVKGPLSRMRLEDGIETNTTRSIERSDVVSRDLFILQITQSLEGGFDSVNMYDKGIVSWGIMQWAARYGSLTECFKYIKRRLLATGQSKLWDKYFVSNGLDVNSDNLIVYGQELTTPMATRIAFRGTGKVGKYDLNLVQHWAIVLARAGRQPAIANLQVEYASKIVDAVLERRLNGVSFQPPGRSGITPEDLAANDPYSEALIFALWTNNPLHAYEYVADAANAAHKVSVSDDPALFPPGAFRSALFQRCASSEFSNWQQRANLVEAREMQVRTSAPYLLTPFEQGYQVVVAERKSLHLTQLASRSMSRPRVPMQPGNDDEVFSQLRPVLMAQRAILSPSFSLSTIRPFNGLSSEGQNSQTAAPDLQFLWTTPDDLFTQATSPPGDPETGVSSTTPLQP